MGESLTVTTGARLLKRIARKVRLSRFDRKYLQDALEHADSTCTLIARQLAYIKWVRNHRYASEDDYGSIVYYPQKCKDLQCVTCKSDRLPSVTDVNNI